MGIGSIIGGVASIGGSILAGNAQKKAANKAADTSLQVAQQNNALARDIYGQNTARLDPFAARGNVAGNAIMELLGYGPGTGGQQSFGPATAFPQPVGQPIPAGSSGAISSLSPAVRNSGIGPSAFNRAQNRVALESLGSGGFAPRSGTMNALMSGASPQTMGGQTTAAQPSARSAFDAWRDSTAYNFQLDEASKALNQNFAARGSLQSGAAIKALQDRRQNMAQGSLMDYIGLLSNQQGVGLSGASAVAGVGQNYVNNVSSNNQLAGNVAANAALASGNAQAGMFGNIAGGLTGALGAFGSSYGGGPNMAGINSMIGRNNLALSNGAASFNPWGL